MGISCTFIFTSEILFQIDHKKFEDSDLGYLSLPSMRQELTEGQKPQYGGISLSGKDSFTIHTNVCSTKLTQNGNSVLSTITMVWAVTSGYREEMKQECDQ